MKKRLLAIASLSVCSVFAGPLVRKGGHVVQLSTGETVKVGYYDETAVDSVARKPVGNRTVIIFQSSSGAIIGMNSTGTPSGRIESTIWSAKGPDRISFEEDLEFRHKGLPVPTTIEINGERVKLLIEDDPSGQHGKQVRSQLAGRVAKLSPEFAGALRELARLGFAGYSDLGTGWIGLLHIFEPSDVATGLRIVSKSPMTEADQKLIGDSLHQHK